MTEFAEAVEAYRDAAHARIDALADVRAAQDAEQSALETWARSQQGERDAFAALVAAMPARPAATVATA
jgi:hypothetical protein